MKPPRLILLILALVLIGLSWFQVTAARAGLVVRSLTQENVPMVYLAPQQGNNLPGVLVAHGYAGSKQLMLGYGHVLAHAGYAVMLWDFDGHGANPNSLQRYELQQNLDVALDALLQQPEVDRTRLALLGHSMGSGIVMSAGIRDVDRYAATIAISPTGASVTPQAPRNLQLQVGSWETGFIANAQRLLVAAGGMSQGLLRGSGRELVIVPNVEHITILFSDVSHQAAVRWLNETFNRQSNSSYADRRMGWYGLHLLGWLIVIGAIAPSVASQLTVPKVKVPEWRGWVGLLAAPVAASLGLTLLNPLIDLQSLGGVQVGGAIGVWFLIAGLIWLGINARLPRPTVRAVGLGIALFVLLWIAFGVMAQFVWLQWWLIPSRLKLWLPLSIACFPWFLASGLVQENTKLGKRVLWWLGQSVILIGGFLLVLQFLPQLSFVFLLLPLFPPLVAILSLTGVLLKEAWTYAIGSALFFGWILAAGFPLSA